MSAVTLSIHTGTGNSTYWAGGSGYTTCIVGSFDKDTVVTAISFLSSNAGANGTVTPVIYKGGTKVATGPSFNVSGSNTMYTAQLSAPYTLLAGQVYNVGFYFQTPNGGSATYRPGDKSSYTGGGRTWTDAYAGEYYISGDISPALGGATNDTNNEPAFFLVLDVNSPPNAPTLNTPANNAVIQKSVSQHFSWTFSDPDSGDTQSKFDLQYRVGTGAWATVSGTTNTFWDAAANTFSAGNTYEWQVRTYDSQGAVGAWSASSFFTANSLPTAPTNVTATSPVRAGIESSTVTWTHNDPDGDPQSKYQLRTRFNFDYKQFNLSANPIGYWRLNESSGTTVADSSTSGFAGTIKSGSSVSSTGVTFGQTGSIPWDADTSMLFNSASSAWIDLGNPTAFQIGKGTLKFKFKSTSTGTSYQGLVVKQYAYSVFLNSGKLVVYDWTASANAFSSTNSYNDGQWHSVVIRFNSGVSGGSDIFVDGVSLGTYTFTTSNNTHSVVVAAGDDSGTGSQFISASIDEVALFNYSLDTTHITKDSLGWIEKSAVSSSTQSGSLDITGMEAGTYEVQVKTADANGFGPYSTSANIQVKLNSAPSVSISSISSSVVKNNSGSVQWNYTDADNDLQTKYQIRTRKKI